METPESLFKWKRTSKRASYLKAAKHFEIGSQSLRHVFANILTSASGVLEYFITLINSGRIRKIFEKNQVAAGYAGFGSIGASVNHDDVIYELQSK